MQKPDGYFDFLDEGRALSSYFDDPVLSPPPVGPPYSGGPPTVAGELAPHMEGRPLQDLCALVSGLDGAKARELVEFGCMWLDKAQKLDPDLPLPRSGTFRINYPEYGPVKFYEPSVERIAFEDDSVIVYNKESGRPSQAVPYDAYNNVHSGLTRLRGLFLRLAHRLDMGCSGLLLMSKTQKASGVLGKAFQKGGVKKRYLALSAGDPPDWEERVVTASIAKVQNRFTVRENGPGMTARTTLKVMGAGGGQVLFLAEPHTGRTHQIRLHMSFMGYPIAGDSFYGGVKADRLMLRASGLAFRHPATKEPLALGGPWEGKAGSLGI
jgi:23S rRNA pseudouridine1911/1915/1917 synthase